MRHPQGAFIISTLGLYLALAMLAVGGERPGVRIRLLNGNLPIVPVRINGQGPFDFVVDTGSDATLIDTSLAADLRLMAHGRQLLTALTGATVVPRYRLDSVQLDGQTVRGMETLATRMEAVRKLDPKVRGLLGSAFLLSFSFRLDYDNLTMNLYRSWQGPGEDGAVRFPVQVSGGLILVRAVADGAVHANWHLALDSGISQILIFAQRTQGSGFPSRAPGTLVTSDFGSRAATSVQIGSLQIGAITLKNCAALVLPSEMSSRNPAEDGLLPASLFGSVYFDRANTSLALYPK